MKPSGRRALDRILDPSYVSGLPELPLTELRHRRGEADHEEAWLSYVRRMLHGRIDILSNRDAVHSDGQLDIDALVASLSAQVGGSDDHLAHLDVIESPGGGRRAVERLIDSSGLDDPAAMDPLDAGARLVQLRDMEREVSQARTAVHQVQDALTAEIARRYREGEVDPEGTLKAGS